MYASVITEHLVRRTLIMNNNNEDSIDRIDLYTDVSFECRRPRQRFAL